MKDPEFICFLLSHFTAMNPPEERHVQNRRSIQYNFFSRIMLTVRINIIYITILSARIYV
jgi:hypothetical protein